MFKKWKSSSEEDKIRIVVVAVLTVISAFVIGNWRVFIGMFLFAWANNIGKKL